MRRLALLAVGLLLPLAPCLSAADAAGQVVLRGDYASGFGDGPLEARFTPDGEGRWKVTFDFVFNGRQHTYRGSAEGSLAEGRLEGRVTNKVGRRTFTFRGEFEDGVYRATHAEVVRGRERETGTLMLAE